MTRKLFLLFGLAVLGLAVTPQVRAQSAVNDKESARVFVQKFYDWYTATSIARNPARKDQPSPEATVMKQQKKYFDTRLGKALSRYYNTPSKDDDIGLDFDPFLNAQDDGPSYRACNVSQKGDIFKVELRDIKKRQSEKTFSKADLLLIVELKKTNSQWVFTNFIYPFKEGDMNLLTLLKNQKKVS
ncbi:DUF3828 domain-containing protein [Mucilaginibacter sp.]|uniref:DUF3828 domain-containing protein n=1 Tax=Mucilaginibacter sp. TaxID=1882438 RepID=UPI002606B549|nr:DUF3828 domain-containing protein [Mucilaginibacter sp.]